MPNQTIRIRKYPNRRLYDTSRSAFITSEELYAIVRSGRKIEVIDSASGGDITNIVLLNAIIDRDPERILSIPTNVFHAMANGGGMSLSAAKDSSDVERLQRELSCATLELDRLRSPCKSKAC